MQPEELRRLKGKAIHVHISDCDGKVHGDLPPGRGVVEFVPYLREIKALGIDGAISIELEYSPEPEQDRRVGRRSLRRDRPADAAGRACEATRPAKSVRSAKSIQFDTPAADFVR